jgi:hypothetical protein
VQQLGSIEVAAIAFGEKDLDTNAIDTLYKAVRAKSIRALLETH